MDLDKEQVAALRDIYADEDVTIEQLAKRFGTQLDIVRKIINNHVFRDDAITWRKRGSRRCRRQILHMFPRVCPQDQARLLDQLKVIARPCQT